MRRKAFLAFLVLVFAVSGIAPAQEYSERKELAVFRLDYYGAPRDPVPKSETVVQLGNVLRVERRVSSNTREIFKQAVGAVDEKIKSVFINMKRFEVIGLDQRLAKENVGAFIEALQDYKADNTELPEEVLLGQEAFTKADFNRLVGSFYVVVPAVSFYNLQREDDGDYHASIETSFTFINTEDSSTVGQFFVDTEGYDEDPVDAMRSAVEGIPAQLTFRVRSMDIFQLRTGVLEVDGNEVILEFGKNMGVKRGDEYAIVRSRVTSTGHELKDETGLVVVKEVEEQFSVGRVLYAEEGAHAGDQLREVPRFGIEVSPYGNLFVSPSEPQLTATFGLKGTGSRGFYRFRPLVGFEIPVTGTVLGLLFPMNLYAGGEWNWYLGRAKLQPSFTLGLGGGVPTVDDWFEEDFYLTHFGATARLTFSYLVSQDVRLYVDGGFGRWFGFFDGAVPSRVTRFFDGYGGYLIGAGVTFK